MLAAAGWPVSELVQPWLSAALRAPDLLASGEKATSILNGGLDKVRSTLNILPCLICLGRGSFDTVA